MSQGLDLLSKSNYEVFHPLILTELARLRVQDGEHLSDEDVGALLQLDVGGREHWCSAEVKRNLGEILLGQGGADRAAQLFAAAADCAERQGALGWALRIALSVARSTTDPAARRRSGERLAGLLARFTGGEKTADVQAARRFLASSLN